MKGMSTQMENKRLTNRYAFNELRINNIFFDSKRQQKYKFPNYRRHKSTINLIVTNRNIHPRRILYILTLNSV